MDEVGMKKTIQVGSVGKRGQRVERGGRETCLSHPAQSQPVPVPFSPAQPSLRLKTHFLITCAPKAAINYRETRAGDVGPASVLRHFL